MDSLTNEETLLSVSRNAAFETPTREKLIGDVSDNLDAGVELQANDGALAPHVGGHGSYSFSMHVLTLPTTCLLKEKFQAPGLLDDECKAGSKNGNKVSLNLPPDKLQKWLAPPNPLTAHKAAHPGTGKWFIEGKSFRRWKKNEKGASLLICGECMLLSPAVPSRLLITYSLRQPGRAKLSFGMQFPERSVH
jgi:hypothetical protein